LDAGVAVEEVSDSATAAAVVPRRLRVAAVAAPAAPLAAQSAARLSQPRRESEAIDEEPHLHFRYRAS
jgi:hypothetical protein